MNSKTAQQLNKFEFYDYKGKAKKQNQNMYMNYVKVNEEMLQMRLKEKGCGETKKSEFTINGQGEGFSMLLAKKPTFYVPLLDHINIKDDSVHQISKKDK